MEVDTLKIGDRVRLSTELIQYLKEQGDRAPICTVIRIEQSEDGLKIVYFQRAMENGS